ncbi:MAG: hypothetical protein ACQEVD_16210 [Actinomycetota bacterium]
MLGLTQHVTIVTAEKIIIRGVETADWSNPTEQTVKAHVFYENAELVNRGSSYVFTRQLTAIMEPVEFDPEFTRIRWQGAMHSVEPPLVREYNRRPKFQSVAMSAL